MFAGRVERLGDLLGHVPLSLMQGDLNGLVSIDVGSLFPISDMSKDIPRS